MTDENETRTAGEGRREEVEPSGIHPASGPPAPDDAEVRTQASLGRKDADADARGEAGRSELNPKRIREDAAEAARRAGDKEA